MLTVSSSPTPYVCICVVDATRDGLRAVKCAMDDMALLPGAGAFEIAAYRMLMRRKQGVQSSYISVHVHIYVSAA